MLYALWESGFLQPDLVLAYGVIELHLARAIQQV